MSKFSPPRSLDSNVAQVGIIVHSVLAYTIENDRGLEDTCTCSRSINALSSLHPFLLIRGMREKAFGIQSYVAGSCILQTRVMYYCLDIEKKDM
jgi:hypothetical protein